MEAIIFCGIQATGKTSFFKDRFFKTHIRISMDQLNTRNKEDKFLDACLSVQQAFVVDNTNPTAVERQKYIALAKNNRFKVVGYYFKSKIDEAMARNQTRKGKEMIKDAGIRSTYSKLQLPQMNEGFDELYYVEIGENGFTVKPWKNEI